MRSVIILFARAPIPGRAKTRLAAAIGAEAAASLHAAFVSDLIESFQHVTTSEVELHTDIPSDAWTRHNVARKLQISGGLELKMLHALESALSAGYHRAAIVGTDAPTLPHAYIHQLLTFSADVALGPADDGGFYAVAARRTHPKMFDAVKWSQEDTLNRTITAIEACGLSVALGRSWFDVDELPDLRRLFAGPLPRHTLEWLQSHTDVTAAWKASSESASGVP